MTLGRMASRVKTASGTDYNGAPCPAGPLHRAAGSGERGGGEVLPEE